MLALVVATLVQTAALTPSSDSTYTTPALRALVERAVVANRRVPESLLAYQARMESELAFVTRQPDGIEQTFAIEQTESSVRWARNGEFEQRVIGYRSQSVGVTVSAVGLFRQAWAVPILYGNRITLLFGQPDSAGRPARRRSRADTTAAVHPFADDRERLYRYSGGDTVVTINPGGREIRIVRVHVEPHGALVTRRTAAFRGDVELDETRAQIVRMRGYFVTVGPERKRRVRFLASQLEAIAYVELENGEYEQRYWLPTSQRIEAQASIAVMGEQRAIFRVISKFRGMTVNPGETSLAVANTDPLGSDTLRLEKHRLTFAPRDSIDGYSGWGREIGTLTGTVRADDFLDVAPDPWRPSGKPIVRLRFQEPSDLVHYNRVEGVYTGLGGELKLRDLAPGFIARGNLGYAWGEQAVRGRGSVERQQGRVWPFVRVARSLDLTNDFREPYDSGSTIGALFSIDDYDYVDRHAATVGLTGFLARRRDIRWRVEGGIGSDRYAHVTRDRGLIAKGDSGFRINRGVDAGSYRQATMKLELRPDVNAAFVRPGIGVMVQGTVATGDLEWQRAELRVVGRRSLGPVIYAAQLDAGVVTGDSIPPQQMFELGENQNLPGYGYKEFAGNQAAVLRGLVMYPLPLWRAPLRLGRWVLPGVGPALSFGAQSGWADASTAAARSAILRLGTVNDTTRGRPGSVSGAPLSRPTDGIKSSIDFRFRFFGGAVSVGVARATDRHQSWKLVAGFAQIL